jgi:ferredoxin
MSEGPRVWIDQKLCTGDGLCTQYAPGVFEFGDASLAYVKDAPDQLLTEHGAQADVPGKWRLDVIGAAGESPANWIHVVRQRRRRDRRP